MWKVFLFLSLVWNKILSKPLVDPGVFVLQGVKTCGNSLGYCLLGLSCTIDKDFLPDTNGGHCKGLSESFTSKISFICCRYAGETNVKEEEYFTTMSTYTKHDFEFEQLEENPIELQLSDEIPEDVDPSSLINIIGVVTDRTGIVSLITEPYTGTVRETSQAATTAATIPVQFDTSTKGNFLSHLFANNKNDEEVSVSSSKIKQPHSPHNEIPIDITFLATKNKNQHSSISGSISVQKKKTTEAYTFTTKSTATSPNSHSTIEMEPTVKDSALDMPDSITTAVKSDLIHLMTDNRNEPANQGIPNKSVINTSALNYTQEDSSTVRYVVIEGPSLSGSSGIIRDSVHGLPAKSDENYVLTPYPTNGYSCGVKNLVQKRRRFEEPSARGSTYDYCWSVAIMLKGSRSLESTFICNGALIEPDLIVTTASCLNRIDKNKLQIYRVVLGDSALHDDLPYGIQYHDISKIFIHPAYEHIGSVRANDIGLIKMKDQATIMENVCLICVPQRGSEISKDFCLLSGYMMQNFNNREGYLVGYLRSRTVVPQEFNECKIDIKVAFGRSDIIPNPDSVICDTFKLSSEMCHTNKTVGSPLTCLSGDKWYLTGLVSWGTDCVNQSTVYTRVSLFSDWILATRIHLSGYITHKFLGSS